MFAKILLHFRKFLKKHRPRLKIILPIVLILVIAIPCIALADDKPLNFNEALVEIAEYWAVILHWLYKLTWPILLMIGGLMDVSVLFGAKETSGNLTMLDALLSVWQIIRNFVNIGFVLVLLGIALYNVIAPPGEGSFQLKQILPKFVIALIAVNFSFFACKVIVDASTALTYAVAAIPDAISVTVPEIELDEEELGGTICTAEDLKTEDAKVSMSAVCAGIGELSDNMKEFFAKNNAQNIAAVIATRFVDVNSLRLMASGSSDIASTIVGILTDLVIFAVVMMALAAMLIVLVVRTIIIWVVMALSPIVAFLWVLPDFAKKFEEFDIKEKFIQHVFAPVIMVAALSIGLVLISAVSHFKGSVVFQEVGLDQAVSAMGIVEKSKDAGAISSLADLLMQIMGIIVIWVGVFGAAGKTYANFITSKIKDMGEGAGKWIAKSPAYLTFIPSKGGNKSPAQLYQELKNATGKRDRNVRDRASDNFQKTTSFIDLAHKGRANLSEEKKKELDNLAVSTSLDHNDYAPKVKAMSLFVKEHPDKEIILGRLSDDVRTMVENDGRDSDETKGNELGRIIQAVVRTSSTASDKDGTQPDITSLKDVKDSDNLIGTLKSNISLVDSASSDQKPEDPGQLINFNSLKTIKQKMNARTQNEDFLMILNRLDGLNAAQQKKAIEDAVGLANGKGANEKLTIDEVLPVIKE